VQVGESSNGADVLALANEPDNVVFKMVAVTDPLNP
jgi:hypothetical protein